MKKIKTFDQLLDQKYDKKGNSERDQFDAYSLAFRLGAMLKEARVDANMTQEELAEKTGTKKAIFPELNAA
jgi:HTH-type transcriptional regulator/antitoxin HipB